MMDVFRSRSGMLTAEELTLALSFAEVAVSTMLHGQDQRADADGFPDDLGSRSQVYQAQGMAMVQLGVSLAEAMVRMRGHAFAHDRRLRDVAADIVARRFAFDPDRS